MFLVVYLEITLHILDVLWILLDWYFSTFQVMQEPYNSLTQFTLLTFCAILVIYIF